MELPPVPAFVPGPRGPIAYIARDGAITGVELTSAEERQDGEESHLVARPTRRGAVVALPTDDGLTVFLTNRRGRVSKSILVTGLPEFSFVTDVRHHKKLLCVMISQARDHDEARVGWGCGEIKRRSRSSADGSR